MVFTMNNGAIIDFMALALGWLSAFRVAFSLLNLFRGMDG